MIINQKHMKSKNEIERVEGKKEKEREAES